MYFDTISRFILPFFRPVSHPKGFWICYVRISYRTEAYPIQPYPYRLPVRLNIVGAMLVATLATAFITEIPERHRKTFSWDAFQCFRRHDVIAFSFYMFFQNIPLGKL